MVRPRFVVGDRIVWCARAATHAATRNACMRRAAPRHRRATGAPPQSRVEEPCARSPAPLRPRGAGARRRS
eukprot:3572250-Prymnesium_polylepis.1